MKNEKNFREIINDHERRISHLESLLSRPVSPALAQEKRALNDHIIDLRNKGFFSQPKTAGETHSKLQDTYSCERNRVEVALLRLSKRHQLRLTSKVVDNKRYQAYVW